MVSEMRRFSQRIASIGSPPVLVPIWPARWAVLLRAGQPLLEPRLVMVPDGLQTESEPHPKRVGSPEESLPPDTWTESGQTPIL
jgi:hypothetical protein